ncbi:MAG: hypothetical protein NZ480_07275 [Bdellovibrionaceae bacterium]|nr:hypothetical protein [Pseudobdellovibrionaceae bacterium]MDW8191032.1 hypothetical protein [Pseudobdellovibrionaceae bacterium]
MKLLIVTTFLVAFSLVAQANPTNMAPLTPAAVCLKLAEAAKNKRFEEFLSYTVNYERHSEKKKRKDGAARFENMHKNYFDRLKNLTCGAEHIAESNAFVEAETDGRKRFIPFVQEKGQWKFDAKTYISFYKYAAGKKEHPRGGMNH